MTGDEIKNERKRQGLSQEQLAKKAGISRNALINYETGKRIPSNSIQLKIADALGLDILHLNINLNDYLRDSISLKNNIKFTTMNDLVKSVIPIDNIAKQAKNDFDNYKHKMSSILSSLELNKINYEIIEQTEHHKLPLKLKILYQDTDFILDTDDLLYIYDIAKSNFDNSIKNIIDIISTFKRENEDQKQGD